MYFFFIRGQGKRDRSEVERTRGEKRNREGGKQTAKIEREVYHYAYLMDPAWAQPRGSEKDAGAWIPPLQDSRFKGEQVYIN